MLELFTGATTNGIRAHIALAESGLPFKATKVDFKKKSPAFLKANPEGRIPALLDTAAYDDKPLALSQGLAVMLYIAEKSGNLLPTNPRERAACYQYLMLQATDLGPAFGMGYSAERATGKAGANKIFRDRALNLYKVMDKRLAKSRFLAGANYSIADIAAYPAATYAIKDFAGVAKLKNLSRWAKDIAARPAVKSVEATLKAWAK
ncbi:MAG: glutathione S-transferase family protein [Pseudomonadota bacterium]